MSTNSFLFVCMGNICRSPALKGILEHLFKKKGIEAYIESCGLHEAFLGSDPDRRMQEVTQKHGITLHNKAKMFDVSYFDQFDAIFCVTEEVYSAIQSFAHTPEHRKKIFMATHFSKTHPDQSIPDPYFNDEKDFELVWELAEEACQGILDHYYP